MISQRTLSRDEAAAAAPPETGTPRPGTGSVRRRPRFRREDVLTGYALVSPQILGFGLLVAAPLVYAAWSSLRDKNLLSGQSEFVGLDNYRELAGDPEFAGVLINSAVFALGVVALTMVLGLLLAVLVNQKIRGVGFFRTMYFLPVVVSLVAWSLVWRLLLQDDGGVNGLFALVGLDGPNWLREPVPAMVAVIVVQVLKNVGFAMILFLAALQEVPLELEEASMLDGANVWQRFRSVVFPIITPTVFMVLMITVIGSLKVFEQIYLLTGGGPGTSTSVLAYYVYNQAFQLFRAGYASAIAMVLFAVVLMLTLLQWWLRKRWVFNEQ